MNAKLVQAIAARAERKIGGSGPVVGTRKHAYARRLLERYQRIYGDRGLRTETSWLHRRQVPYGMRGSVRIDALDIDANVAYDYKFVQNPSGLHANQVQKIQLEGPLGVQVIPVNP